MEFKTPIKYIEFTVLPLMNKFWLEEKKEDDEQNDVFYHDAIFSATIIKEIIIPS